MDILEETRTSPFWKTRLGASLVVFGLVLGITGSLAGWLGGAPQPGSTDETQFTVQPGQGTIVIAHGLKSAGLIRSEQAFAFYVHLQGYTHDLKAGTYLLSPSMDVQQVVDVIVDGRGLSDDIEVTIPEGMNIWEVDAALTKGGLIRAGQLRTQFSHKEGHLFPDTYRFAKDATVQDIVDRMERNFMDKAKTRSDIILITASMLEKEAKSAEDMALVAGIINRRLEIGMPLQLDATVGYGWCLRVKGYSRDCDVTQAPIATEIKVDGPYNTYARTGLPPAAISNPGLRAITAASNPKKSDYLYYLSTRDGSQLVYAKTLAEHLQNRRKYLGF
jgi:UPF0755 protein